MQEDKLNYHWRDASSGGPGKKIRSCLEMSEMCRKSFFQNYLLSICMSVYVFGF